MTILCTARAAATNNLHRKVVEHVELLLIDHAPKFRESLVLGVERSHLIFGGYGSAESRFRQRRAEVVIFPKRSTDAIGKQNPTYPGSVPAQSLKIAPWRREIRRKANNVVR